MCFINQQMLKLQLFSWGKLFDVKIVEDLYLSQAGIPHMFDAFILFSLLGMLISILPVKSYPLEGLGDQFLCKGFLYSWDTFNCSIFIIPLALYLSL